MYTGFPHLGILRTEREVSPTPYPRSITYVDAESKKNFVEFHRPSYGRVPGPYTDQLDALRTSQLHPLEPYERMVGLIIARQLRAD
jgi:hypothetical protein